MNCGIYQSYNTDARRQQTDVFCNDPFKVQSYKFRYAEKPYYPVPHYPRQETRPAEPVQQKINALETFYENPKFNRLDEARTSAMASSFAEHRRRRFLEDVGCILKPAGQQHGTAKVAAQPRVAAVPQRDQPTAVVNSQLLRCCCNPNEYQAMCSGKSVTTIRQDSYRTVEESRPKSATEGTLLQPERNLSTGTFSLSSKTNDSHCNGCAININITGRNSASEQDSDLWIQIRADNSLHNNTDNYKVRRQLKTETQQRGSSQSFVIDKRLSKFNLSETRTLTRTPIGARQYSCENDLIAKREQLKLERQRLELTRQQDLAEEQQRARRREQERERMRQLERERDRERLAELDAERERHRQNEITHQQIMKKAYDDELRYQEQRQRAALRPLVVMTSHLQTISSDDRLPGMAPCYAMHQTASAQRPQNCKRNLEKLRNQKAAERKPKPIEPKLESKSVPEPVSEPEPESIPAAVSAPTLKRCSSFSSNNDVGIQTDNSSRKVSRQSTLRLDEQKLLNLHVNGLPYQPLNTRLNEIPIRITTSQPEDKDLFLSMRKVWVRPASTEEQQNVKINVHAGSNSLQ